jgi:predicted N-acetyltransferase YhbS
VSERIEPCPKERVPELIALLDEEFVLSRGRTISVERRFPEVFFARNLGNLWTVLVDGKVVAAAVAKPFEWLADEKTWTAAMVGLVVTRPELRGRGLASRLLVRLQSHLAQQGSEFAVLWTRHPQFYERLGWIQGDPQEPKLPRIGSHFDRKHDRRSLRRIPEGSGDSGSRIQGVGSGPQAPAVAGVRQPG